MIRFEWDEGKNRGNITKHKVGFEEAAEVFADEHGRIIPDQEHSKDEQRFVLLGMSAALRILVVCHCYRDDTEVIRIISARKANKEETREYGRHLP